MFVLKFITITFHINLSQSLLLNNDFFSKSFSFFLFFFFLVGACTKDDDCLSVGTCNSGVCICPPPFDSEICNQGNLIKFNFFVIEKKG